MTRYVRILSVVFIILGMVGVLVGFIEFLAGNDRDKIQGLMLLVFGLAGTYFPACVLVWLERAAPTSAPVKDTRDPWMMPKATGPAPPTETTLTGRLVR